MRPLLFSTVLGGVLLGAALLPAEAEAHGGRRFRAFYGPAWYGAYYPSYSYYGFGGHDFYPHWHTTYSPFGAYSWYGRGAHDYFPHRHRFTPFSYESYSYGPGWVTRSYYPRYYFAPW